MKPKKSDQCSLKSIAEGIGRLEFMQRVSNEIMKALSDPACSCPLEARNQWMEMNQSERISFVSASLECFYWVYVSRIEKDQSIPYPSWESASTYQQVITAASFCLFILGTEFEQHEYEGVNTMDSLSTHWVN
jgi:hypothetical protein